MWLSKIADVIYKILNPFSKVLLVLGAVVLMFAMLLTTADVVMRYFFNHPINGAFDLAEYLLVIVFAAALPYCTIKKGHISVDILTSHLSKKLQTVILGIMAPISLAMFTLIAWQIFIAIGIQRDSHIVSSVLLVPRYPFLAVLFLGYVCFILVLLADFLKLLSREANK